MKSRKCLVANSSSSSFIIVKAGNNTLVDISVGDEWGSSMQDIDTFISKLEQAKKDGATHVEFEFGGSYEG